MIHEVKGMCRRCQQTWRRPVVRLAAGGAALNQRVGLTGEPGEGGRPFLPPLVKKGEGGEVAHAFIPALFDIVERRARLTAGVDGIHLRPPPALGQRLPRSAYLFLHPPAHPCAAIKAFRSLDRVTCKPVYLCVGERC